MAATFQQLIAQLKNGGTFESLLRLFVPSAEQDMLRYCAATRTFDEKLFNEIFLPALTATHRDHQVTFEVLRKSRAVEPASGVEGCYQLRESSRKEYLGLWQKAESTTLAAFSDKLASYYKALGPGFELDVLYQLIVADSVEAKKQFLSLYQEADSRFDLGRCQDVLRILEERYSLLDSELQTVFKDRHHLLKARGLWSREHYQTVNYYEIKELESRFDSLWNHPRKWILQLHARGGTGKTMFLRWLIARHCVPEPRRIPCARIDFDFIDAEFATQNPSILLLELAQQLNEQIPGNLFGEALGDMRQFKPILVKSDSVVPEHTQLVADAKRRASTDDIPDRFANALETAAQQQNKKALLIMDTLEEVILYEGTQMIPLLKAIASLRGKGSNIRLILSGRYDLTKKLPDFEREFGDQTETLQLAPFDDDDARRYLVEKRGITRLLDPVIKRANGNPFQLALYADVLHSNPRLTAKAIEEFPAGVLYLIERILDRIKDPRVCWLLRYGVVPRKLRLSFVKEVMAQYLPPAMSGKTQDDDPKKDLVAEFKGKNPFPKVLRSAKSRVDFEEIWQQLTQYSSWNSWVNPDDEENTLSFHPEVTNPMRRWLRNHRIFRKLHRAAIRYYERKAKEFPNNAGPSIKEAVYHKFQLDGVDAGVYWRKQLNNPVIAQRPEWVQLLARDVVNLAIQAQQEDASENGERLVDEALLCEAYFEVAQTNVKMARANQADPDDTLWQEAAKDYRYATKLQNQLKKKVISPARMAFVHAALLISQKDFRKAHQVLHDALKRSPKAQDRVELEIEFADSFSRQGDRRQAARHYYAALRFGSKARLKSAQLIDITKRLAGHYEALGEFTKAIKQYKAALASANKTANGLAILELSRRIAEDYLAIGQLEPALLHARPKLGGRHLVGQELPKVQIEQMRLSLFRGRLERERLLPLTALKNFNDVWRLVGSISPSPDLSSLSGSVREQIALVYNDLNQTSRALDELEEAVQLFKEARDDASVIRCTLHKVDINLNYAHNVKAARQLLAHVDDLTSRALTPSSIPHELLRIKVLDHTDRPRTAQRRRQSLSSIAKRENWPPHARAEIALAGVSHRATTTSSVSLRETVTTLKRVSPGSHRLALLKYLRLCPTPKRVAGRLSNTLCELLPAPNYQQPAGAVNALTLADALRVVGKKASPNNLLAKANEEFRKKNNLYALTEVYRTWDRLGWHSDPLFQELRISEFVTEYSNYPHAGVVVRLEHAQRLLNHQEFIEAQKIIGEVESEINNITDLSPYWIGLLDELKGRLMIEPFWATHQKGAKLEHSEQKVLKLGVAQLTQARVAFKKLQNLFAVKRVNSYITAEKRKLAAAKRKLDRPAASTSSEDVPPPKTGTQTQTKSIESARENSSVTTGEVDLYSELSEHFAQVTLAAKPYAVRIARSGESVSIAAASQRKQAMRVPQQNIKKLSSIFIAPRGEVLSNRFTKLLVEDWGSVTKEMFSVLRTDPSLRKRKLTGAKPIGLGLEIDDIQLNSIPWEFILIANSPGARVPSLSINSIYRTFADESRLFNLVTSLQLGLQKLYPTRKSNVDGFYGPKTVRNVLIFQSENNLPVTGIADYETFKHLHTLLSSSFPIRALIVQPSTERQVASERGHGSGGISLGWEYDNHGFRTEVLEQPTFSGLARALTETKPQILHLCASMARSTSSGINLDFGTKVQFSFSALSKILEQFTFAQKIRPFVILDVPRPSVMSEVVTQLLLRNAFAATLMRMSNTSAILATGLFSPSVQQRSFTDVLLTSLSEGLSFGEIADEIRSMPYKLPQELVQQAFGTKLSLSFLIGPLGTALFTQDPSGLIL